MSVPPVLLTERFALKATRFLEWPRYKDLMMSNRSIYMGDPFSEAEAWGWFCHDVGQWAMFGHGSFSILEKGSDVCLGAVSLNDGPLFPELEMGWLLFPGAEGKGVAFEAATEVKSWALGSWVLQLW